MNNISLSLAKRQLVDSIWKSAGIEGLGTTFPNTEKILDNLPVQTRRDEVLFIVNMKRGWEFLFDNIEYPTNIMFLRELNKITMDNIIYEAGNIRNIPVSIGGTTWTPEIPNTAEIIEDINKIVNMEDKLDSALELFCYISRKQMFVDGNKRLAELMVNKVMIENDLGIFSIPYNEIDNFKELLIKFYETNNNTEIKQFFKDKCLLLNPNYNKDNIENDNNLEMDL